LYRVPLHIRVSPETRQRLQCLHTEWHLNVGAWLRTLIDEALDREFGPAPTGANELAALVKAAPPEPIPGCTPVRLMVNEVGPKVLHRDPIRLYVLTSSPGSNSR